MNKTVEKSYETMDDVYKGYIPELEIGEVCELNDVWDGRSPNPINEPDNNGSYSYSYQLNDLDYINYVFQIVERNNDNDLDTVIKIIDIEII